MQRSREDVDYTRLAGLRGWVIAFEEMGGAPSRKKRAS